MHVYIVKNDRALIIICKHGAGICNIFVLKSDSRAGRNIDGAIAILSDNVHVLHRNGVDLAFFFNADAGGCAAGLDIILSKGIARAVDDQIRVFAVVIDFHAFFGHFDVIGKQDIMDCFILQCLDKACVVVNRRLTRGGILDAQSMRETGLNEQHQCRQRNDECQCDRQFAFYQFPYHNKTSIFDFNS